MGDLLQPWHLIVLAVVAFLLFGAKRLPELGKGLGEGLKGFKEGIRGIRIHLHRCRMFSRALLLLRQPRRLSRSRADQRAIRAKEPGLDLHFGERTDSSRCARRRFWGFHETCAKAQVFVRSGQKGRF